MLKNSLIFFKLSGTPTPPEFPRKQARENCLNLFGIPSLVNPNAKQQLYSVFQSEARILYYILVRTVLPKTFSREIPNDKAFELIYLIMTSTPFNFATFILDHMFKSIDVKRATPLPYPNLLTHVFNHFGVNLEGEACINKKITRIGQETLKNLGMYKLGDGRWKFENDMNSEEKEYVQAVHGATLTSATVSSKSLSALESRVKKLEDSILFFKDSQAEIGQQLQEAKAQIEAMQKKMEEVEAWYKSSDTSSPKSP